MGQLFFENDQILYEDDGRKEVLYGHEERITNYSHVPHQLINGGDSLLGLVLDGVNEHEIIAGGTNEKDATCEYATMNLLLAREHMKTPYELKVLEIGCSSGVLSYHLAKMLGKYNEDSQLCCVTNSMEHKNGSGWTDRISRVESMPKVSFLATDYDKMPLPDRYFDVVVLNASEVFEKKEMILSEVRRVLKNDGAFLAYVVRDVDLIQQIAYRSASLKTYMYLPDRCLLRVESSDFLPGAKTEEVVSYNRKGVTDGCDEMLNGNASAEELRNMIRSLDAWIDEAIAERDLESKILFIRYKGQLLDKLVKTEYGR